MVTIRDHVAVGSIKAGGPGSGRHPEFGKFKYLGTVGAFKHYATERGSHVSYAADQGSYGGVHEVREDGRMKHSGDSASAEKFLSSRYGIRQEGASKSSKIPADFDPMKHGR